MQTKPPLMQPDSNEVKRIIAMALSEDIGQGDITSAAIIPAGTKATMQLVAREPMVVCGVDIAAQVFLSVDAGLDVQILQPDGTNISADKPLAVITGEALSILTAERVALNLMQRMCGIASLAARYVAAVKDTGAVILDTRKTMPGLRELDKYAVRVGGAHNHRMRLDDQVLIKDNHIAVAGGVAQALAKVAASVPPGIKVEIECDTLEQVGQALAAGATMLLLDNMSNEQLSQAVVMAKGKATTEASGNVSLETIGDIARTGVDFISIGRITHSVPNMDIGLDAA